MSERIPYEELTPDEKDIVDHGGIVTVNTRKRAAELKSVIDEAKKDLERAGAKQEEEEKEKPEEDEEAKKEKVRFNEQAFLMLNIDDFVNMSAKDCARFKYFGQIMHDDPSQLNNLIFKRKPEFDILLNSTSAQVSYLVPKIRIFKEYVNAQNQITSIELPISEGYRDEDFSNIYKSKAGRGGGVGVKSFNWNTIGNNSGNQYSFGADLELFFESIEEIVKVRTIQDNIKTSFADLLIQQKAKDASGEYNPNYYRIKALIGWHIPKKPEGVIKQEFLKEIEASNMSLYLGLHSHELKINEDGTVELKLKFIAYIEALMDSPKSSNIFYAEDSPLQTTITNLKKSLEELRELSKQDEEQSISSAKEIEKIEKILETKETESRTKIYSRILTGIRDSGLIRYEVASMQDFQTFIDESKKVSFNNEASIDAYKLKLEAIRNSNKGILPSSSPGNSLSGKPARNTTADNLSIPKNPDELREEFKKNIDNYNKALEENLKSFGEDKKPIPYFFLGDLIDKVVEGMYNPGPGNATFLNKQVKLFLGPLIFYDYGRLEDGGTVVKSGSRKKIISPSETMPADAKVEEKIYTGKKTVVNISDIPISLSIFNSWFLNKIIDAGVVNMNIKDFLNAILNDLVIRALGTETFSFAPRQKSRLVYKAKTLRKNNNRLLKQEGSAAPLSTMLENNNQQVELNDYRYQAINFSSNPFYDLSGIVEEKEELDNFIFIYSVSSNAFELKSNYAEDFSRGVRHLQYGNENGLIKNISFNRVDNQLIRSHNMKIASTANSDKSIILREVYNATVEMMGNSIFELGELVYITPTLFGLSKNITSDGVVRDRVEFAKELGIGGYFMILGIKSSISEGSYKTSLELRWNAKGDGIQNNVMDGLPLKKKQDDGVKIGIQ